MSNIISNNKTYNLIIIIIIILTIIYLFNKNCYKINSIDNFDNLKDFNGLEIVDLPVINGLIGAYTADSIYNNIWKDISGSRNHAIIKGPIIQVDNYITGTIDTSLEFPKTILPETYTLFHLAKYNGKNTGRIFSGIGTNWLSGFNKGIIGAAYHEGWLSIGNQKSDKWLLSTDQNSLYRGNLYNLTTGFAKSSTNLSINSERDANLDRSDWAIACILVFNRKLSLTEINLIEYSLLNKYSNIITKKEKTIGNIDNTMINIEKTLIYKDNYIELKSLIHSDVYLNDLNNIKNISSPDVIYKIDKYYNINKTSSILNIKTKDDIELLMIDGKFRLRVNLPLMPPYIKGMNFDIINGSNPNYFYLGVIKLDPNCQIQDNNTCKNLYIDNKDCKNKLLSDNIDNSYRLALIPGSYAIDTLFELNNIDFTLIKKNGLTYLMNVNTGYLPKLFFNDTVVPIYGKILNNSDSNIKTIIEETNNIICNEQLNININEETLNIACSYNQDESQYLFTTNDIDNSSPVSFLINNNNTIKISLDKYGICGDIEDSFVLSFCNYNIKTLEHIEKSTITNLEQIFVNIVCLNSINYNLNNLEFTVESLYYVEENILNSSIKTII